jgi:hypothetical protein
VQPDGLREGGRIKKREGKENRVRERRERDV